MLREFALNLLAVTSVLWLIFIATRFSRYLAQAAVGNIPSEVIFTLLGYSSLGALSILLPLATFLAIILALGRMNSDNELTVIYACGIARSRVIRNVVLFSGSIALIISLLALFIVPNALADRYALEQRAKMSADTSGLIAGKFKESRDGSWTFYSQALTSDKQEMLNVFIELHKKAQPLVFRAKRGRFEIDATTGNKYLILENGYRYEGLAGEHNYTITEYESHSLLIEKGEEKQTRERHRALPTLLLWERGSDWDLSEVQWRASAGVMTVIISLFAIVFANSGPRKGRYAGLFPAILIYIIYSNLLGVTRSWITKGLMSPLLGALWVHILMLLVLVILLNKQHIRSQWQQYRQRREAV